MNSADEDFIQRFLDSDRDAVETVDTWILQAMRSFRYRLGNDYEDTQQDIRLEIQTLLRSGKFRLESNLKAYLQTVARHTCLDRLRSIDRRSNYLLDTDGDQVLAQLELDGISISTLEPRHEQRDLMQKVIAAMPEDCWRIWSMIVAGFSYAEISAEFGIKEGTMRVRAQRCRQKAIEMRRTLTQNRDPSSKASPEE